MPAPATIDSPIWRHLHRMGGRVELEELRYTCSRRGLELEQEHLDDLVERGYVVRVGDQYQAVVPKRTDHRGKGKGWSDEEVIDRIRLWALIVGRPPTKKSWNPAQIRRMIPPLRRRLDAWEQIMALYKEGDWPSETVVRERFGSLNAALVVAGYEPRSAGTQPCEPDSVPRPVRRLRWGPEALRQAGERAERARERGDKAELREALYELAAAAFAEADRLEAAR